MVLIFNKILAVLTVSSHVLLVLGFVYYFVVRKEKENKVITFLGEHGIQFAFFFALIAMCSSLFYSDVIGYEPCMLCWYQRIFMYPLVFIFGLAWFKKDSKILPYTTLLASLGLIISLYHNYIYFGGTGFFSCDASGLGVSCLRQYVFEFDYVTIPSMALTSFILILVFSKLHQIYSSKNK